MLRRPPVSTTTASTCNTMLTVNNVLALGTTYIHIYIYMCVCVLYEYLYIYVHLIIISNMVFLIYHCFNVMQLLYSNSIW